MILSRCASSLLGLSMLLGGASQLGGCSSERKTSTNNDVLYADCETNAECLSAGLLCDEERGCVECLESSDCPSDEQCQRGRCRSEDSANNTDAATNPQSDAGGDSDAPKADDSKSDDSKTDTSDDDDSKADDSKTDDVTAGGATAKDSSADSSAGNGGAGSGNASGGAASDTSDGSAGAKTTSGGAGGSDSTGSAAGTTSDPANNAGASAGSAGAAACNSADCGAICGDGLVRAEQCDDGNTVDGDGCSATCTIEANAQCTEAELTCETIGGLCVMRLAATFRDQSATHPDFGELSYSGLETGLVAADLDATGRPQLGIVSSSIESPTTFFDWYNDTANNVTVEGEIILFDNSAGGFVNRFGPEGQQLELIEYGTDSAGCVDGCASDASNLLQCTSRCLPDQSAVSVANNAYDEAVDLGEASEAELTELLATIDAAELLLTACATTCETEQAAQAAACELTCAPCSYDVTQECHGGIPIAYDGDPLFFPVDDITGATRDPGEAKLPEAYGFLGWPWESDYYPEALQHNFYFTTEVKARFRYTSDMNATLDFLGDDDVWVFINGILAVDLGGIHVPEAGTVTINSNSASTYNLVSGNTYDLVVFHAERQMEGSSFKLALTGFDTPRGVSSCSVK